MKEKLIEFLKKNIELKLDFETLLEKPKLIEHGDFAFPVFNLAKELKKSPAIIAKELELDLSKNKPEFLKKIVALGPYLNFYLNSKIESKDVIENILTKKCFENNFGQNKKILIEYPSPNTNKALHLGHVRNILIGNSLSNILNSTGYKVIRTNLNNDRGIAICKSMLGYQMFFSKDTHENLGLKSDEFISKCYVKFEAEAEIDKSLNEVAQEMLVKWENGDKKTITLWKKVLKLVFKGYKETYKNYKLKSFDKEYFESEIYDKGKELVLEALKNKVNGFEKEEDNAIFCDLTDIKLDKKYLLRGDGTSLYMTQDLYLAYLKEKEFKADRYIFIVGKEQEYHFKVLFEILSRIGSFNVNKNYHFAYGYVYDKDGKKFSSRKGKTIGADWLLDEVIERAKKNLKSKELTKNLTEKEFERRAIIIGYSALAFSFLKVNPIDDIKFDIERALMFEGETGPYIQYTYARIKSVLRKAKYKPNIKINYDLFGEKEIQLIKILKEYSDVLKEASDKYKISLIANYLTKVAQSYNDFYQNCPIIKENEEVKNARATLCFVTCEILKEGLALLDIEVLEEM